MSEEGKESAVAKGIAKINECFPGVEVQTKVLGEELRFMARPIKGGLPLFFGCLDRGEPKKVVVDPRIIHVVQETFEELGFKVEPGKRA